MKSKFALSFLVVSAIFSGQAVAGDAVVGAIIGSGVGAAVGNSMGGRDGAVVGGMLGAMTGVMIATDKDGHRDRDVRIRPDDRYGDYHRGHDRTRIVYRDQPTVIYKPAPVIVVKDRPRVVVVDSHPGRGQGWKHGHRQHKWQARHHRAYDRDYAYQGYGRGYSD